MATAEEKAGTPEIDEGFTHAEDVLADGDPAGPKAADPAPKQLKEEDEAGGKESGKAEARDLKSTLLISGAVVAVVGAIFAIAKKIKQA